MQAGDDDENEARLFDVLCFVGRSSCICKHAGFGFVQSSEVVTVSRTGHIALNSKSHVELDFEFGDI